MFLTKEQILKADDLKQEEVDVPEWGGKVLVRALNGKERDEFEKTVFFEKGKVEKENWTNLRARLVALTVVDEKKKRLFTLNDIEALGSKSASALDRLFTVSMKLSGLSKEDAEKMTKN